MAIGDNQKVDFLWKKLGYGVAKTDTNSNKLAANESINSPLLLRADKLLTDAHTIPNVIPSSSTSTLDVYPSSAPVECIIDNTASANRTWKTGITDWLTPEFGSTYLVKVYIHTSGDPAGAGSLSNQVFITGSGNNDEWFFDYQAGVLNFIGDNLPSGKSFSGKSVYISGAVYTGTFGLSASATQGLGVIEVNDNPNVNVTNVANIKFNTNNGFNLTDEGNGDVLVEVNRTDDLLDLGISDGVAGQVLTTDGSGNFTFTDHLVSDSIPATEVFEVTASTQSSFTLATTPADAEAIDVYVNGVIQVPGASENYTINGAILSLNDPAPQSTEVIIRHRSQHATMTQPQANSITNNHINFTYTSHEYTGDGSTVDFTCQADHTIHSVLVFINGLIVSTNDYSVSGSTLTFSTAPALSDVVIFRYMPI